MGRGFLNHFLASDHYVCRCHQGHCDSEPADLSLAMNCRQGHTHLTAKLTAGSLPLSRPDHGTPAHQVRLWANSSQYCTSVLVGLWVTREMLLVNH